MPAEPAMKAEPAGPGRPARGEAKLLALIGSGHFFSHFYLIVLPPLFPLL